jgi:RHS repeat-associated protein
MNWGFSSKYVDHETGLSYYGLRYYHPSTGRWINRDPIEEQGGSNLAAICRNDLVNRIDPNGLLDSFTDQMVRTGAGPSDFNGTTNWHDTRSDSDNESLLDKLLNIHFDGGGFYNLTDFEATGFNFYPELDVTTDDKVSMAYAYALKQNRSSFTITEWDHAYTEYAVTTPDWVGANNSIGGFLIQVRGTGRQKTVSGGKCEWQFSGEVRIQDTFKFDLYVPGLMQSHRSGWGNFKNDLMWGLDQGLRIGTIGLVNPGPVDVKSNWFHVEQSIAPHGRAISKLNQLH